MVTTNLATGITNAPVDSALGTFIAPDPTVAYVYSDDFASFIAAEWTITKHTVRCNAGGCQRLGHGILALTNTAANNDLNAIQLANETFAFTAGKRAWFKCRFQLSSATNAAAVIGLQITDTTPLAVSDGVFFSKAAASTTLNLVVEKTSTATTTAVGTMADATYVDTGFYYDGQNTITAYLNGQSVATSVVTNLPTHTLCISAAVSNGTAADQTMNCDYIFAAFDR